MSSWSFKDSIPLFSLGIALLSLVLVFYKDFIQGAHLNTVLNTVVIVRVPENNKSALLEEIILDDLLSDHPSKQAQNIMNMSTPLVEVVKSKNRQIIQNTLKNFSLEVSKTGKKIIYDPSSESIIKYFGNKNLTIGIYIPLIISNTGRKTGDISTLILKITSLSNPQNKWIFGCFTEVRADEFTKFNSTQPYGTIIGKIFPGISIGPTNNYRLDAFMIPLEKINDKLISTTTLVPGKYKVQVIGFGSKNEKSLESNEAILNFQPKMLIDAFNGSNISTNLSMDESVEKIL